MTNNERKILWEKWQLKKKKEKKNNNNSEKNVKKKNVRKWTNEWEKIKKIKKRQIMIKMSGAQ